MKLPSLQFVLDQTLETYRRFPFAVLSAVVGTGATIYIFQLESVEASSYWLYKSAAVAFLGISLNVLAQLWAERASLPFSRWLLFQVSVNLVLVLYALVLPDNIFEAPAHHVIRLAMFAVAAHLFVAVGPFMRAGSVGEFWEFNKTLFLRFLAAGVYSFVLFAGLSIALLAVENLFNVDIANKRYGQLWWFLAGIFNTWFFLSGIPRVAPENKETPQYLRGLKVFTQYVMIPLVAIYFAILYAYMMKIVVEWDWPKGWVGYLVLGFSTTGIFSLLLIHPIKDSLENRWMAVVTRHFYGVILAPAILLLLAIWRRISEYGVTENRYIVVVLGFWILGIALYFLFSKGKSIKAIPLSLGILALVASSGPWSASSVSLDNQMDRLETVLVQNGILTEGKVGRALTQPSFQDRRRISSVIRYVAEVHGLETLQPWFEEPLDSIERAHVNRWRYVDVSVRRVMEIMGIEYVSERQQETEFTVERHSFEAKPWTHRVDRDTYIFSGSLLLRGAGPATFLVGRESWEIGLTDDALSLELLRGKGGQSADRVEFQLSPTIKGLARNCSSAFYGAHIVAAESLTVEQDLGDTRVRILMRNLDLLKDSSGVHITSVRPEVFLTVEERR